MLSLDSSRRPPGLRQWTQRSKKELQFSSVAQSCPTLPPHELQHARPPCPSPTPGVYSNSCPSSRWCHPAVSSSVIPFSSCPQSLPTSRSFPMRQLFARGGQSIGVSASVSVLSHSQNTVFVEWCTFAQGHNRHTWQREAKVIEAHELEEMKQLNRLNWGLLQGGPLQRGHPHGRKQFDKKHLGIT